MRKTDEGVPPMNCAEFQEVVHDLDRPDTEGFAARDSVLAHAESCSGCARLLTEAEWLDFGLGSLATASAETEASPRLATLLTAEFRRQRVASARRRVRWQIAALGTAAALFLALGLSLQHWPSLRLHGTATPNVVARGVVPSVGTGVDVDAQSAASAKDSWQSQFDDSQAADSATAFVPVPYADNTAAVDGGAVVRVVLSRSALASLGMPVTDVTATDRIPADIVVSEDGSPQAIRLVSQASLDQ